jgi:hypothetical protein
MPNPTRNSTPTLSHPLEKELATYEQHKPTLVQTASGKFVLIKGCDVIDVFETQPDAINSGYQRFGVVPFLVNGISFRFGLGFKKKDAETKNLFSKRQNSTERKMGVR